MPQRGKRSLARVNRTHPLARGLVAYELFSEQPMRSGILCYDRVLSKTEIEHLVREPYAMFEIRNISEGKSPIEEFAETKEEVDSVVILPYGNLYRRKLRIRR